MASSLSDEEFGRIQTQLIELRTTNYDLESQNQRLQAELIQVQEKSTNQEKELQKTNKIINRSKNKKEYAVLLEENENLQMQFQAQEENFKLQNQTLLEEINKLNAENEELQHEVKQCSPREAGSEETRRLKAENAALQKSLTSSQERYEVELASLRNKLRDLSAGENLEVDGRANKTETPSDDSATEGSQVTTTTDDDPSNAEETFSHRLDELLHKELHRFCEQLTCSTTGDVSQEQASSSRHEVVGLALEHCPTDGPDGSAVGGRRGAEEEEDNANAADKGADTRLQKDVGELRLRLSGDILQLVNSNEGLQIKTSRPPIKDIIQQAEMRSASLEKQLKDMAGQQLQLDTEREEKRLLQEHLKSAEVVSKKEIARLEGELTKWTDKAKRKQESYLQLQEEKEKLYLENKTTLDEFHSTKQNEIQLFTEQMAKIQDELNTVNQRYMEYKETNNRRVQDLEKSLSSEQTQASTNAEETVKLMAGLRHDNETLAADVTKLKEKLKLTSEEQEESEDLIHQLETKVANSETKNADLALEFEEVQQQLKEQHSAVDSCREQIPHLTTERDQLAESLQEASKLAENRKTLVDEMAIEKQNSETEHREQLEKQQDEHRRAVVEIKEQLSGEKKLRKELEEYQQRLSETKTKLTSEENKCGWFERRLSETEESLKTNKDQSEKNVEELRNQHQQELEEIQEEKNKEQEEFESQIAALEKEMQTHHEEVETLRQEVKDKEVESRIAGKKGDQLVKDLKRQVRLERKRGDQLQQKLQETLSESKVKHGFDDLFTPMQRRNSGDSSLLSQPLRGEIDSPDRRTSPTSSFTGALNDDTIDLIDRLADVQQEKWLLEEKVKHLEQTGGAFAEDLIQKSAIIQAYAMETKLGPVAESPKPAPLALLKEKIKLPFAKGKTDTKRLQLMLEETLMKNLQLQTDIDCLSKELESCKQNKKSNSSVEINSEAAQSTEDN